MEMLEAIKTLEGLAENPTEGLPEDLFSFISSITPMINVDLLIKDEKKRTLLTWRNDDMGYIGWHIPGGIIRYKETAENRINAVAKNELGTKVNFSKEPICIQEIFIPPRRRGHFISLLYKCSCIAPLNPNLEYKGGELKKGQWAWHDQTPDDIIDVHLVYKDFIDG